ncbi:hypothetical protein C7M84_004653 [Penaeus vannamei]|uniref:Sodium-coupled monocarboxylate transporter 1 n=1 Tax=Penaeus vannamei TaxID=6689 RepID=A0A423TJW8_PENVA|nr:hypothetical protein C7M84_004653 [Penaeus vannamei]
MNIFGCAVGVVLVRNVILPVVYPLRLVSLFQYIEMRFRSRLLRKYATACQLTSCYIYVGICLYAPSLALSSVTSLPTWASVLVMGVVCTFYITIGGVKAVVYTDVLQTLVMFFGVLAVVAGRVPGHRRHHPGVGGRRGRTEAGVFQRALFRKAICFAQSQRPGIHHPGRFFLCRAKPVRSGVASRLALTSIPIPSLDTSPFARHTLWSTLVVGVYMMISFLGLSQSQYQRFASVPTLAQAQMLALLFFLGLTLLWGTFYVSGLVAYAIYSDCDPLNSGKIEKADQIIPYMVSDKLGHLTGMPGLFVAAVYGGVLSSLSSEGNAIACVVWEDFLKERPYFRDISDRSATNVIKCLSSLTGLIAIGVGLLAGKLGTIYYVISLIGAVIAGPLNGLFLAGMVIPWTNAKGAWAGMTFSLALNSWMVIGRTDENTIYDISYCYNGAIGIISNLVVSSLVSCCTGPHLPGDVEARLVYAPCARLYRSLFLLVGGGGGGAVTPRSRRSDGSGSGNAAQAGLILRKNDY